MTSKKWLRTAVGAAVVVAIAAMAPGASPTGPALAAAPSPDLGPGGEYHPLTPERVFDTRPSEGLYDVAPLGRKPTSAGVTKAEAATFHLDILDRGGVPTDATDVLGVVLNVTVNAPTHPGFLSVYPKGFDIGDDGGNLSSLINFNGGDSVSNVAIVAVGDDDEITFHPATPGNAGQIDVIVDVLGWVSTSAHDEQGARLVPVTPGRIFDSREGFNPNGPGVPLPPNSSISLPIRGADAVDPAQIDIVPDSADVTAVMVNLTLINTESTGAPTFVSATPDPVPTGQFPSTSSSNALPGAIKANMAIVPIGSDGNIHLYNRDGDLHLAVDVLGYLQQVSDSTTREGRIVPLVAPFRAFDTRDPDFDSKPLGFGSSEDWSFKDFANSVTLQGEPIGEQTGLIGNLTGTDLQQDPGTFLQMYPAGVERPQTSNINVFTGQSVPNMSLLKYGTIQDDPATTDVNEFDEYVVTAFNVAGRLHYLLDVYAVVLSDGN